MWGWKREWVSVLVSVWVGGFSDSIWWTAAACSDKPCSLSIDDVVEGDVYDMICVEDTKKHEDENWYEGKLESSPLFP